MPLPACCFRNFACIVTAFLAVGTPVTGMAQTPNAATVVARIDGEPITLGNVNQMLALVPGGNNIAAASLPLFQAQALEQLIQRRLVLRVLDAEKYSVNDEEIDAAISNIESQLSGQAASTEQLLRHRGLSREQLREQLGWETTWNRYVRDHTSDEELARHFDEHHRDFDGTQVRVSHILLRPTGAGDLAALQSLGQRANQIRAEIVAGRMSFADAAKQFSAGPSREKGGDLGFIPRYEQMVESFSRAAFALEKGAVSEPVITNFGIHLILCTDVQPGTKTWRDVREQLEKAVAVKLFARLAAQERLKVKIEYTGEIAYLDPQTGQLVAPKGNPPTE